jgi:uncharacterized membrane protein
MDEGLIFAITVVELAGIGLLVLLLPRVTRRGLLFGVYVGSDSAGGEEARGITRAWYRDMTLAIVLCVAAALALWSAGRQLLAFLLPDFLLLAGLTASYLRGHAAARRIARSQAPQAPPPAAVASLRPSRPGLALPALTLIVCAGAGLLTLWHAWTNFDALPDRIPTHFSGSGKPDAWSDKSFGSVMVLPITTLATAVVMGALAFLVARAKRAIRLEKKGISLLAQQKYRSVIVGYICGLTFLVTAMLGIMSFGSIQVGLGEAERLSPVGLIFSLIVALWAIAGAIYIAVRVGQGGAKLEESVSHEPLTDGLADNEKWKLGAIYVNREDPSMFVEHRFGLGYTINFGNAKAVAFLIFLLVALVFVPLWLSLAQ